MAACCGAAGAIGGVFVGWLYGRDQASHAAHIPWYGIGGLLLGAFFGLLISLAPAAVLILLRGRGWAAAPVRIVLAALAAAAPLTLYMLAVSNFDPVGEVMVFCVFVTAVPAGLAAAWLAYRPN